MPFTNIKELNSTQNSNRFLEKAITKSQRCQRNWDLSKKIPIEDIKTLKTSVTQCGSKQNRVFYKCKFITNRDIIERIYEASSGRGWSSNDSKSHYTLEELGFRSPQEAIRKDYISKANNTWAKSTYDNGPLTKNPQVLANLLVAFVRDRDPSEGYRTKDERIHGKNILHKQNLEDEKIALGIGAGYLTLTANMLGYASGCCQCGDMKEFMNILGESEPILLLMGIGYPDTTRSRLLHHVNSTKFQSYNKHVIVEDVA